VLERDHGIELPKWLHPLVSRAVQNVAEAEGQEVLSRQVYSIFESDFLNVPDGWRLEGYDLQSEAHKTIGKFRIAVAGGAVELVGAGQGLIECLADAVSKRFGKRMAITQFDEHALTPGTEAKALASVVVAIDDKQSAACCIAEDSSFAVLQATLSAVGRALPAGIALKKAG
jgi:2-isopropylmalate synthase